jgi:hypothetical protein
VDRHREPSVARVRLIAVESVAMLGGGIVLRGAPNRVPPHAGGQVRPAVVASLERSIRDHGDVWAELAKH